MLQDCNGPIFKLYKKWWLSLNEAWYVVLQLKYNLRVGKLFTWFLFCRCVMCFIGVYFITAGRAQSDDSETRDILNALRRDGLLKYIPGRIRSTKNKYQCPSRSHTWEQGSIMGNYAPTLQLRLINLLSWSTQLRPVYTYHLHARIHHHQSLSLCQ